MTDSLILLENRRPGVTTLTLNRPGRRNALTIELMSQLCDAVAMVAADRDKRILIIQGAGSVFCSGLDLKEAADPAVARSSGDMVVRMLRTVSQTRLITLASVRGAAVAGGAGLMSACDFAIATEGTRIGYPEARRGLVAGLVMTFLRRQLRERDIRELLLTSELINARKAQQIGLVNRVVAETELEETLNSISNSILEGGPEAISRTKVLLSEMWFSSMEHDLDKALKCHLEARNSEEAKEGILAFLEKRRPNWTDTR